MRAFVTGCSGFIGRALCVQLRCLGWEVFGSSRLFPGDICDRWQSVDMRDECNWDKLLTGVDVVFHAAGKAHSLAEMQQDEREYFRVNVLGTEKLLKSSHRVGVRRLVLFSSIKAMSNSSGGEGLGSDGVARCLSECEGDLPDTIYGKSKLEAERLVISGGFIPEPVVLRLCMVYGVGAKGNIIKMLDAVRQGRFPPLPDVGNRRSMVHVEDVVSAALLAAMHPKAPGIPFIVSDGVGYSTRQIYELMCAALKKPVPSWHLPIWMLSLLGFMGDGIGRLRGRRCGFDSDALEKLIGSAWYSSKLIQEHLGFIPRWNLERALPEMVASLPPVKMR